MQKRFQQKKTRGPRASKATPAKSAEPRAAGEVSTDWRARRVPVRKFSEKVLNKKKPADSSRSDDAPAPRTATRKRKSDIAEFQRILVPIDFSAQSARAMKFAAAMARRNQSDLTLVHVVGPVHDLRDFDYANQRLNTLARKNLQKGIEWQPVVRKGNGPDQILQEAQEMEADVIVMSPRGLSEGPSSKLGSIARQIIRSSPCPVLIFPGAKASKSNASVRRKR